MKPACVSNLGSGPNFSSWEFQNIFVAWRSGLSIAGNCSASEKLDRLRHVTGNNLIIFSAPRLLATPSHQDGMLPAQHHTKGTGESLATRATLILLGSSCLLFWGRCYSSILSFDFAVLLCRILTSTYVRTRQTYHFFSLTKPLQLTKLVRSTMSVDTYWYTVVVQLCLVWIYYTSLYRLSISRQA